MPPFAAATLCLAALVGGLDAPRYRHREAAHAALHSLGPLAVPALEWGLASPRPEVRQRCERLLWPYEEELLNRRAARIRPTRWPRLPWLYYEEGTISHYLSEARRHVTWQDELGYGGKTGPPHWDDYRVATLLWIRAQLWQRRPVPEIVERLDRMANDEYWWILQHGNNYNPPVTLPEGWK